ncbi:MAG: hypothetical protein RLZ51_1270 [Pseudomonadota bacterium]
MALSQAGVAAPTGVSAAGVGASGVSSAGSAGAFSGSMAVPGGVAAPAGMPGGAFQGGLPAATATSGAATSGPAGGNVPSALPGATPNNGAAQGNSDSAASEATDAPQPNTLAPRESTQFQRFVAETTGRSLPLFGYDLFGRGAFPALNNLPVPDNYILRPGDRIEVRVWGSFDAGYEFTIDARGLVLVPRVGPITLAGTRADQLNSLLRKHFSRAYTNFELSATPSRLRSIQIYVVGEAARPGAYQVSSLSTLISALFQSGGPSSLGSLRAIELKRAGKTLSTIDLYQFLLNGDKSQDQMLQAGDVIVIPRAGPRVAVLGAVDKQAIYELLGSQDSIESLLKISNGGLGVLTTPHKALLERVNAKELKAPRTIEERVLNDAGLRSTVRDGDVLTLFKISPEFANAVTLRGNVAAPLRYAHRPGMKVSDLIPETDALIQVDYYQRKNAMVQFESGANVSGGRVIGDVRNLLEEINWEYAAIERLDGKEVRTQLIPFNLRRAVKDKDPAHDLPLQVGDVVTIFGIKDLPVPMERRTQFVRIGGEVKVPGVYQLQAGDTLPALVARAGGFTAQAFVYGTVFTRESTRAQQQANLNKAIAQLQAEVANQTAGALQNVIGKDDAGVVQAQLAGQRILLARLQGLRASGRVALEMDPVKPELPPLMLEDSDSITVPSRPSFIGVYGAVTTEASLIHRPERTASDYIDKAGLTRTADLDATVIIRADGTVEGNGAQRNPLVSWMRAGVLDRTLNPGDTLFVPDVIDRRTAWSRFVEGAKDITAIFYQFGIGAAAVKTLRN